MKYFILSIGFVILFIAGTVAPHVASAATSTVIDANAFATLNSHNGTTFTDVFISSSTGYAFLRNATGSCAFDKTTNGGTTWSAEKIIDPQTDCLRVAVWYDRWTPGNTTGTLIYVATIDSSADDIWYTKLDTSNDSTSTPVDISTEFNSSFGVGRTLQSITEGTNGNLYSGVYNQNGDFVLRCTASCTTSSSWVAIASTTALGTAADDWMLLLPLPSGNILNVRAVIASGTYESKVWNNGSSTWSSSWTTIDNNCPVNTTYDGGFGAAVNSISNDIYMAYVCNNATIKANTGAIRTQTYDSSSSTWNRDADVETSSTLGLTGTKLGMDINTGNVYVVYTGQVTPKTTTSTNVYYKISTSTTMSGWGSRQGPINGTTSDIYGARIDGMSNARIYATWIDSDDPSLNGQTVAIFSPTTYSETVYKFFQNLNSDAVGNYFDIQNASSIIPVAGTPFRLRMLVSVGGAGVDIDGQYFKLQYATSSNGACAPDFSDGLSYVDVGTATSSAISYYNNSGTTNGDPLTANTADPTDGTNISVNETYVEQNTFTDDIQKILTGQDGKWDFALINNSGATGQNYCFRIVKNDGSLLTSYGVVASAQVDAVPTMGSVSLNNGSSISLMMSTTTPITATATITDANGPADFYSISGSLYRTSLGSSCTADNNNCYPSTSTTCSASGCVGNSCMAYCTFNVWYYAQPTDSGTPWSGDSWTALMTVSDTVLSGASATSTGVNVLSLLAFTTTSTIGYGNLNQGQGMATLTASSVIRSAGNTAMNVTVYGTNMTSGAFSIPVGQQHFATSSLTYASGTTLLVNPGSTVAIDLKKPTSSTNLPSSTFYWGITIPSGQMATTYSGYNSFIGVEAPLPWP